jgi:hypothetical protein
MKNLIKEEINEIKYLFGYQRGVVISEQPSKEEPTKIKSPYILDKVETAIKITGKIDSTDELLTNLIKKKLYIYNKPTTCNTSAMKNMIGGKEATTDDTVLPFPYIIDVVKVNSKEAFIGKELPSPNTPFIYMVLTPSQEKYDDKDLSLKIEQITLFIMWRKETGWKIHSGGGDRRQPVYNACLEKALNEMLPDGLAKIKKEKTDFGYVQGDDKNLA